MIVKRIKLHNWKNFQKCEVKLYDRCFIVGANASGKSNFIDALRFLRDISKQSGGLQRAVEERGGITKIRCLAARKLSNVAITVELGEPDIEELTWRYSLDFIHTGGGVMKNQVIIQSEEVYHYPTHKQILSRPLNTKDKEDNETLKYTYLEQPNSNREFRSLQAFFQNIEYINIIPQLVRESALITHFGSKDDYYGRLFLKKIANKNERTIKSYFSKINEFLVLAVPQLKELGLVKDEMGVPHLEVRYEHWRAKGSKQQEPQLSDGTLRLIGFLFALIDHSGVTLLEEPELNLHAGIVGKIPEFIAKVLRQKKQSRQIILTTHSYDILSNGGISADEVLLLQNTAEGTTVNRVSDIPDIQNILEAGLSMADAVIPATKPSNIERVSQVNLLSEK